MSGVAANHVSVRALFPVQGGMLDSHRHFYTGSTENAGVEIHVFWDVRLVLNSRD
jgi:hypothetical protein